jgi:hypothetical protein
MSPACAQGRLSGAPNCAILFKEANPLPTRIASWDAANPAQIVEDSDQAKRCAQRVRHFTWQFDNVLFLLGLAVVHSVTPEVQKGETAMSKALRTLFLVHVVTALVFGVPLIIVPGRFLELVDWAPIDPIAGRLLGAALLALGWSSFRGWQATAQPGVRVLVELEAVFTGLACVGLARHLFVGSYPVFPWLVFAVFAIFFLAWAYFLVRRD